ncbi:MAG: hypothetical protein ABFE13_26645 [Phycisphaerales bacterium]
MEWRKGIWVVVTVLVARGVACADMTHGSERAFEGPVTDAVYSPPDPRPFGDGEFSVCLPIAADADPFWAGLLAEAEVDIDDLSEPTAASWILSDRQDSFDLCLYTLLGLGVCRSAPWAKRLSLGVVPGWYHDGVPFQVGHSSAVSTDCLCPSLVCFVQPETDPDDLLLRYDRESFTSLWRRSQCGPAAFASRGPPPIS